MTLLRYHRAWLLIGAGLIVLVFYLSLTAHPPKLLHFRASDKLEHFSAYFVLMAWFVQLYHSHRSRLIWALLFMAQGMAIEVMQGMSRWRTFDYYDALANTLGVTLAWWWSFRGLDRLLPALERHLPGRDRHVE
jgi:VanZ family protein